MIWLFEREGKYFRYEARPAEDGLGYELVITYPGGSELVERFDDSAALSRRQKELEEQLSNEGWRGPHGWFA
jgi:hypothetical protein